MKCSQCGVRISGSKVAGPAFGPWAPRACHGSLPPRRAEALPPPAGDLRPLQPPCPRLQAQQIFSTASAELGRQGGLGRAPASRLLSAQTGQRPRPNIWAWEPALHHRRVRQSLGLTARPPSPAIHSRPFPLPLSPFSPWQHLEWVPLLASPSTLGFSARTRLPRSAIHSAWTSCRERVWC